MKKTSIKDSNNTIVSFVGNQQWGGFLIDSPRGSFEFANEQGPALALLAIEACGYGGSVAAGVLHSLIRDLAEDKDPVVDAVVLDDPADAVRTALDALTKAGVRQREHETARYGSPASLEHAACILTEWIDMDERAAKAEADQKALEGEAFGLYSAAPFTHGVESFPELSPGAQIQWLSIARAARKMHGVAA